LTECRVRCRVVPVITGTEPGGSANEDTPWLDGGDGFRVKVAESYGISAEERYLPVWFEIEVDGDLDGPGWFTRIEIRDGAPCCTELRFTSPPGVREIRQIDLRRVQLAALVEDFTAAWSLKVIRGEDGQVESMEIPWIGTAAHGQARRAVQRARAVRGRRAITPEVLRTVAEVYRENLSSYPTKAVRETFGVSERMASEYVQRARRAGLLPPTVAGKKKA